MKHRHLEPLDLEGLSLIDNGLVNQMFKHHQLKIGHDLDDRPGEPGKRTVTITLTAQPVMDQQGKIAFVKTSIDVKSKLPIHRTKVYQLRCDKDAGLVFNPDDVDSVNQLNLFPSEVKDPE